MGLIVGLLNEFDLIENFEFQIWVYEFLNFFSPLKLNFIIVVVLGLLIFSGNVKADAKKIILFW